MIDLIDCRYSQGRRRLAAALSKREVARKPDNDLQAFCSFYRNMMPISSDLGNSDSVNLSKIYKNNLNHRLLVNAIDVTWRCSRCLEFAQTLNHQVQNRPQENIRTRLFVYFCSTPEPFVEFISSVPNSSDEQPHSKPTLMTSLFKHL